MIPAELKTEWTACIVLRVVLLRSRKAGTWLVEDDLLPDPHPSSICQQERDNLTRDPANSNEPLLDN